MTDIPRKYIVDEQNKRVAVQLDIDTFEKLEDILENYSLVQLMKQDEGEEKLALGEVKAFYHSLDKAEWKSSTESVFWKSLQRSRPPTEKASRTLYLKNFPVSSR